MGPLDDLILQNILRTDSSRKVLQKEDDKIEYKEKFENESKEAKAKYAKEMAALYNCEGGYLIFGVTKEYLLVGLDEAKEIDNADLVKDISNYFSPSIKFDSKLITLNGMPVFVIYVYKRDSIPTVCIKGHQDILKESTIYWRYSGEANPIRPGDLINLLNVLKSDNSKELVEIQKKDFRSKFRPRLWINGLMKSEGEVQFTIENRGEIAHIDSLEIIDSNSKQIYPPTWKNYPIDKDKSARIMVRSMDTHWQQLHFKLAINHRDDENHKYQSIIEFKNGKSVLETMEL